MGPHYAARVTTRPPRALALSLLLAALLATGCGEAEDPLGARAPGDTVTVYSSLPLEGRIDSPIQDIVDGEKLALAEAGARAGRYDVRMVSLDSAPDGRLDPTHVADNAREAVKDASIIAYLGEYDLRATETSLPILNAAGVPQLNMSPEQVELDIDRLSPSGRRTFVTAFPQPAAGFEERFRRRFGAAPRPEAIRGYGAMRAVLAAIAASGERGDDRRAVAQALLQR